MAAAEEGLFKILKRQSGDRKSQRHSQQPAHQPCGHRMLREVRFQWMANGIHEGDVHQVAAVGEGSQSHERLVLQNARHRYVSFADPALSFTRNADARATIVATNAITFRSGFVRDITGTGTLLAYRAGAPLQKATIASCAPM